jgi:hypothetical protein
VRQTIQAYLNLVDWEQLLGEGCRESTQDWSTSLELVKCQECHNDTPAPSREMGQRIAYLIHEPVHQTVLEELEEIKELLDTRTKLHRFLGHSQPDRGQTIRECTRLVSDPDVVSEVVIIFSSLVILAKRYQTVQILPRNL